MTRLMSPVSPLSLPLINHLEVIDKTTTKKENGTSCDEKRVQNANKSNWTGDGVEYGRLHYLRGGSSSVWWASLPPSIPSSLERGAAREAAAGEGWLAWGGGASGGTGQWALSHLGLIAQWARAVEGGGAHRLTSKAPRPGLGPGRSILKCFRYRY
jgi:hypothetical protein